MIETKLNGKEIFEIALKLLHEEFDKKFTPKELENLKNFETLTIRRLPINGAIALINYDKDFEIWCRCEGTFFNLTKKLIGEYNLDDEQQYNYLREVYSSELFHCMTFNGESLIKQNVVQYVEEDLIYEMQDHLDYKNLAFLLSNQDNFDLYDTIRRSEKYTKSGLFARNLTGLITLPIDIDYNQIVERNNTIDTYNEIFDDTCYYEYWPSKILFLVAEKAENNPHPIKYLNQENIISLAKSLDRHGPGNGANTNTRIKEFYDIIMRRVATGDLTLFDYNNESLKEIKKSVSKELNLRTSASYTKFILTYFQDPPIKEKDIDAKVLKKLISYSPNNF
ncbi:MAG: hypothetical protein PHQ89_03165 [Bacilli bacterium]|nr:hypothetical protein [Bacilli bacterium]